MQRGRNDAENLGSAGSGERRENRIEIYLNRKS